MSADPRPEPQEPKSLEDYLQDIDALQQIVDTWTDEQKMAVKALRQSIDELHGEAIVRMIRALQSEPAAGALLRQAASDDVVYSVLRHMGIVKASLQERVEQALESVRPMLASHGGGVELVSVDPPDTVVIRLVGACDGCPASSLTLSQGVEKAITESCPEITTVRQAKGLGGVNSNSNFVSPFANPDDVGWHKVCELLEIPEQGVVVREVDNESVLLSRFADRVVCYQNACAHLGLPLENGLVSDGLLTCPHHGFVFALDSGECLTVREVQLHTHGVRVQKGTVEVKLQ